MIPDDMSLEESMAALFDAGRISRRTYNCILRSTDHDWTLTTRTWDRSRRTAQEDTTVRTAGDMRAMLSSGMPIVRNLGITTYRELCEGFATVPMTPDSPTPGEFRTEIARLQAEVERLKRAQERYAMQLELLVWGDGTTRLTYWDHMHSNDRVFVLEADGAVSETHTIDDSGNEERTPVDLVAVLRAMAGEEQS